MDFLNDGHTVFILLVTVIPGSVLFIFRGHMIWYRELRGGHWVEMQHSHKRLPCLWRKKGSRWFGIWRGWSNWYENGIYYKTRSAKRKGVRAKPLPITPWPEGSVPGITKEARAKQLAQKPTTTLHAVSPSVQEERAA